MSDDNLDLPPPDALAGTPAPGTASAPPATKQGKAARAKAAKVLPSDRVAFAKQLEIVRAYGQGGMNGKAVTNGDVASMVNLHPSTTSLTNNFFVDVGFVQRGSDGQLPAPEVIAFARAHEWKQENPAHKLAPLLANTWFGQALLPKVRFRAHSMQEALGVLAEAAGAAPEHRTQLTTLLEFLQASGLIAIEGDSVKPAAVAEQTQETKMAPRTEQPAEPARPQYAGAVISVPEKFTVYKCKLRRDLTIDVALPDDLTGKDVERLYTWMKTHIFDDETRSEPTK